MLLLVVCVHTAAPAAAVEGLLWAATTGKIEGLLRTPLVWYNSCEYYVEVEARTMIQNSRLKFRPNFGY